MATTWSRNAGGVESTAQGRAPVASNTAQNSQTSSSTEGSTNQTTNQTVATNQQNMSDSSLAALETLIQQLMGGGTQGQARQMAERQSEIDNVKAQRAVYSKDAAFTDAQGAMAQQLRQAMESVLPTLTKAAEGAGTSQNALRALLVQDAQNKAAQSASALGLNAATAYGGIASNLSGILESLTRQTDPVTQALLAALGTAKGAVVSGTQTTNGTQSGSSSSNTEQASTQAGNVNYRGGGSAGGNSSEQNTGFFSVGPTFDPTQLDSLAWSNLIKASGANDGYGLANLLDTGRLSDRTTFEG